MLERSTVTDASGRPVDLAALTSDPTSIAEAGEDLGGDSADLGDDEDDEFDDGDTAGDAL